MKNITKRNDYWSWKKTFIKISEIISRRSKDPNTQVGACITNKDNIIVGIGYNGLPKKLNDDSINWTRDKRLKYNKYKYVIHAEVNAILNSGGNSLIDTSIYVTELPCIRCSLIISQTGISNIYYTSSNSSTEEEIVKIKEFCKNVSVCITKLIV